jgi:hypothetical protein
LQVKNVERASKYDRYQAPAGKEYDFVEATVQNNSSDEIDLSSTLFFNPATLRDKDNFQYASVKSVRSPELGAAGNKLKKGDKARGWLTFLVPAQTKGLVLEFTPGSANPLFPGANLLRLGLDADAPTSLTFNPSATPASASGDVGEAVGAGSFIMTVTKVEVSDEIDMGGAFGKVKAESGKQFVALEIVFESLSDSDVNVNRNGASLKDSDGFRYQAGGRTRQPEMGFVTNLAKGTKMRGWITFEIPKTAKGLVFDYSPIAGSGKGKVDLQVTLNN